jgi:hypothetical protein
MQCSFALIAAVVLAHQSAAQAQNVAPRETAAVSQTQVLSIRNVTVQLDIPDASFRVGTAELTAWVERSCRSLPTLTAAFPRTTCRCVGREVTADELRADWVMVHEMAHLALPQVGRWHPWLAEGVATYVEGVARVQAGNRTAAAVWTELVNSIPQ